MTNRWGWGLDLNKWVIKKSWPTNRWLVFAPGADEPLTFSRGASAISYVQRQIRTAEWDHAVIRSAKALHRSISR